MDPISRPCHFSPQKPYSRCESGHGQHHGPSLTTKPDNGLVDNGSPCQKQHSRGGSGHQHPTSQLQLSASTEAGGAVCSRVQVDLNSCNYHELCVVGLTKSQAIDLVDYRVCHSHFVSTADITQVPGISDETYERVQSKLTLIPGMVFLPSYGKHEARGAMCSRMRVDLNACDYHELCVVGLTKSQAMNLVDYRVVHGHFVSTVDIIRVPGISTEMYERVQSKLTVSSSRPFSCGKQPQPTLVTNLVRSRVQVDLNSCNYHELCAVGLTKSQAIHLVNYRVFHGQYVSMADITRVPGISDETYERVHSKLTLKPGAVFSSRHRSPGRQQARTTPSQSASLITSSSLGVGAQLPESPSNGINRAKAVPGSSPHTPGTKHASPGNFKSSSRRLSSGGRGGKTNLHVASWNLQAFNSEKVERPGVLEVICCIIVKHGFDIVAVQELGDKTSLKRVCEELNHPSLPKVQQLGNNARKWNCCVSDTHIGRMYRGMEYSGFLWNECAGVTLDECCLVQSDHFVRQPLLGRFSVNALQFVVIGVHLKAENWGGKDKQRVEAEVYNLPSLIELAGLRGPNNVILVGDFNMHPGSQCFSPLLEFGFKHVFNDEDHTNISEVNPGGSRCYDNIWVCDASGPPTSFASPGLRRLQGAGLGLQYDGTCRVVRRGLSVPVRVGERPYTVSDHCPIWAGFKVTT